MTEDEIRSQAFAMPIYNPAFPPGPYRFIAAITAPLRDIIPIMAA